MILQMNQMKRSVVQTHQNIRAAMIIPLDDVDRKCATPSVQTASLMFQTSQIASFININNRQTTNTG